MALRGGRGLKTDPNTQIESYSLRTDAIDTWQEPALFVGPQYFLALNVDIPTSTVQFLLLPSLKHDFAPKYAYLYVSTAVALGTVSTALYTYKPSTGEVTKIAGTDAIFDAATVGRKQITLKDNIKLIPGNYYFLGYTANSSTIRVRGMSADSWWPVRIPAIPGTSLPTAAKIKSANTAVDNAPAVVYLSVLGKEFFE